VTRPTRGRVDALWGALALAAVLVTAAFARRTMAGPGNAGTVPPRRIAGAARLSQAGIIVGDSAAPIRIVEFADFECRHCRQFQKTLAALRARHPKTVAVVYRHWPLSRMGFAFPAAIAAECAAWQGRFEPFAVLLFESQDTLVRLDLEYTAARAGVRDTARFHACRSGPEARARVIEDMLAGKQLGVGGTPTFVVGDILVIGEVSLETLENLVRRAGGGDFK